MAMAQSNNTLMTYGARLFHFLKVASVATVTAGTLAALWYNFGWETAAAAGLAGMIILYWFRPKDPKNHEARDIQGEVKKKGAFLGPILIWFFIGLIVYVPVLVIMLLLAGVRYANNLASWSDLYLVFGVPGAAVLIAFIWIFDAKKFKVDTAKLAALTFLGFRIKIYLTEGNYYFDPNNFLIGTTTKVAEPFTDALGNLEAGEIAFQLWDSARRIDGKPNLQIKLNAMHGAAVILTVTLKGVLIDPQRNLTPNDAPLLFGDSGRKAVRRGSTVLVDLDISETPGVLGDLMMGYHVVSARLSDTYKHHREGSLMLDKNGVRKYIPVQPGKTKEETKERVEAAKQELIEWFNKPENQKRFDKEVIELITDEGDLRVDDIWIDTTLLGTANEIGFKVTEVLVSDVELSETVQLSTNKASAEPHEAVSELRTAKSARAAGAEYAAAVNEHGRDAVLLGAAATGTQGVQNFNIPGLVDAAKAVLASLGERKGK